MCGWHRAITWFLELSLICIVLKRLYSNDSVIEVFFTLLTSMKMNTCTTLTKQKLYTWLLPKKNINKFTSNRIYIYYIYTFISVQQICFIQHQEDQALSFWMFSEYATPCSSSCSVQAGLLQCSLGRSSRQFYQTFTINPESGSMIDF